MDEQKNKMNKHFSCLLLFKSQYFLGYSFTFHFSWTAVFKSWSFWHQKSQKPCFKIAVQRSHAFGNERFPLKIETVLERSISQRFISSIVRTDKRPIEQPKMSEKVTKVELLKDYKSKSILPRCPDVWRVNNETSLLNKLLNLTAKSFFPPLPPLANKNQQIKKSNLNRTKNSHSCIRSSTRLFSQVFAGDNHLLNSKALVKIREKTPLRFPDSYNFSFFTRMFKQLYWIFWRYWIKYQNFK